MSKTTFKTSISIDVALEKPARRRAAELGFKKSFSAYIVKLIEDDLAKSEKPIVPPEEIERTIAKLRQSAESQREQHDPPKRRT